MSCILSRYEILFLPAKALLVWFKSNVELTEGAGHRLQHHSSDESHVLAFFFFSSPVRVSSPIACKEGTLL